MKTVITEETATTLGGRLRIARVEAGMTLKDAEVWLRLHMPKSYWRTGSTLLRMEERPDSETVDAVLVAALAWAYGVPARALSPRIEQECEWAMAIARWGLIVGLDGEAPVNADSSLTDVGRLPHSERRDGPFTAGWARPRPEEWVARGSNPEPAGFQVAA